jgi:flagellin
MANIGATTAFYKVETSLTRANNEVSKSMERLATGKQNANAGDRSSYVAMSDTFRLDYVGTKAGIKGASVAMGYLETGMRVIDSASALLSRLQELAVLGANNTNTTADNEAINLEAEAVADEFNRLMTTSTYKGKDIFVDSAGDQEIALGGRGSEMTFGIGRVSYSDLYNTTAQTISGDPNDTESFNLVGLPSDAIASKTYGTAESQDDAESGTVTLTAGKKYVVRGVDPTTDEIAMTDTTHEPSAASVATAISASSLSIKDNAGASVTGSGSLASAQVITVTTTSTIAQTSATGNIHTTALGATDLTGEIKTLDALAGTSASDATRRAGTYTVSGGSITGSVAGTGAEFTVTVLSDGTTSVTVANGGKGYAADETLTLAKAATGGTGADITFDIATGGVTTNALRTDAKEHLIGTSDYSYSGSTGSGATFSVVIDGSGSADVRVTSAGSGYANNDTITIDGETFGSGGADLLITLTTSEIGEATSGSVKYAEVQTGANAFQSGQSYVIQSLGSTNSAGDITSTDSDALIISRAFTNENGTQITTNLAVGQTITMASLNQVIGGSAVTQEQLDAANALIEGMTFTRPTETLTGKIETVQNLLNRARVEAGSQYAAMESAVSYTTDLTAQYELGFNMVNDVNFSAETAHLAKNQILQQAATAMLAQANSGQQGLLQLIQG